MTDLLSSPRPLGDGTIAHRPDWTWLPPGAAPTDADLTRAARQAEQLLAGHGVTYGAEAVDGDRHWRLDPLPVVVDEPEWARLEAALVQRAELLDAVLHDLYGARRLLDDRLLPPSTVLAHPGFLRAVDGLRLPGGRELVLTATDLVRDASGGWCVVADRTQAPSGAGYAMEDRRVTAQVLAPVYRQASIARLGPFFHALRKALREVAPPTAGDDPRAVLLSPGPASETAFDQAYLASMLGLPLVEGSDLVVRAGRLYLQGIDGLEPVDVVLRRVDGEWCDPLDLRAGSRLGVPGLVHAVRQGAVSVVNPLGTSVLENPALLGYLPRLARAVLDQDLTLPSAPTWWCGEERALRHVLARLDRLVLKPVVHGSSTTTLLGWRLTTAEREQLAARITAEPWRWVGQELVGPGAEPADDGPRAAVMRAFAVAHAGSYTVMSGGLARVADDHVVSSSAVGALAKDVWVLASPPTAPVSALREDVDAGVGRAGAYGISPRAAENLYWMGRYAERAEDGVRVLRAVADRWDDYHRTPDSAGGQALAVLLEALTPAALPDGGEPVSIHPDTEHIGPRVPALRDLLLDQRTAGSVARAVRRLAAAAATVRDQLSTDMFGPLARIERTLRDERARVRVRQQAGDVLDVGPVPPGSVTAGLRPTLDRVLESLLAVSGIAAEGLTRDVGWHLLDAGRRLERAQRLVAVLRATLVEHRPADVEDLLLESVLLASESAITYRRRHQSRTDVARVLDLLVHDRTNPRSLAFTLDRLHADLESVPAPRSAAQRDHLLQGVAELVAELDTVVVGNEVSDDGRRVRLVDALESILWRLREASDEIERVHFVRPTPSRALDDLWGSTYGEPSEGGAL
ncbi:circularly permuted type 2 ATP-grasp protein [Cellulomonas dongxiuzhuiae]|uniref:Circularly permuted type 2 ATP-grasp protein n=1 Tax=Cellulomonas dongxiuzhuiae TaxID=2819979 RepID=A0ABX8GJ84_9CELL|nr:circularly permuted type 2 ATP-grasp protein [Cellulomonas dongxiuzhuiae]MBO3089619.1 circularly permuted type 2 ATP-grasp protein [Cellulomonas dongxiuzhuiae]MBO3095256.1 circularly permuted type 2 ATP-grasp protein [Cellulomonas dongxiuzhuiae]QWC16253.1 circularly permuted type 2 ATP-grasp protein [Cellulomonas dongxiuzhuiae]